jgi:nicotinamidase-related amidase
MPSRNQDLHGSAPDKSKVALLLVDVINDLAFPEADQMLETLLRYLGSQRLIVTGIAGNYCVLFTANDAYMRDCE